jgi:hypothetical protein
VRPLHVAAAAAVVALWLGASDLVPPAETAVVVGGILVIVLAAIGFRGRLPGLLVAQMAVGALVVDAAVAPRLDLVRSPRAVSARIDALVPPRTGEVGIYPDAYYGAFNLYSPRLRLTPLATAADAAGFLAEPGRRLVLSSRRALLSNDSAGRALARNMPPNARVVAAGRVGRSALLLLVNFDPG